MQISLKVNNNQARSLLSPVLISDWLTKEKGSWFFVVSVIAYFFL